MICGPKILLTPTGSTPSGRPVKVLVSKYALSASLAAAILAGCGASQPSIGTSSAMPQISTIAARADRDTSWIPPGTTAGHSANYDVSGPLLYVANANIAYSDVTVYRANGNDPVPIATIPDDLNAPGGDCFEPTRGTALGPQMSPIKLWRVWPVEYAFGKTVPSKIITEGLDTPAFCAIDGGGNLWVTNIGGPNATEYLYGSKKPHTVITKDMVYPTGIAIDSSGNVYISNRLPASGGDICCLPARKARFPCRCTITDGATSPVALAIDASGDLYVTNVTQNNIEEYPPGGDRPFRTITQGVWTPGGLTISKKGWLFAANLERDTVVEFRPGSARRSKRSISSGLHGPIGLAIYPAVLP